tara:strand:- start:36 stop:254 length:219 start_codon:yes stop_codon:yes gene_type:complete
MNETNKGEKMTKEQLLENYLANLGKALALVDDTDDLSFEMILLDNLIVHKQNIYNRISNLMDMIEKEIEKGE